MDQKLFSKGFTLVVIGQIISLFGNATIRFALPLYLLNVFQKNLLTEEKDTIVKICFKMFNRFRLVFIEWTKTMRAGRCFPS